MSNLSYDALRTTDDLDNQLIADFACLDPIYVDGMAGVLNLGANFAALYFRWTPRRIESGQLIYERSPALNLVRPQASIACTQDCGLLKWINGSRPPLVIDQRNLQ